MTPEGRVGPGASTRLIALLGDPVAHSLSPRIQNAAFRATGVDGRYLALRCAEEDLPGLLKGIARAGGGGNVTLPHKEEAARSVEVVTDAARLTGAVNTFWLVEGRIHGDNTDVPGFQRALRALLGEPPRGARALVLGAGGACRAAVLGLLRDGAETVHILNRTVDRARTVAHQMGDERVAVLEGPGSVDKGAWDVVVNATTLGMSAEDPLPVDLNGLPSPVAVLDLVYRPEGTPLVKEARRLGLTAEDGGEMLVQQGAQAYSRWWGEEAPVGVMREALARARTEPGEGGGR